MEKKCKKCGELKSLTEFHKDIRIKGGLVNTCKVCICKRKREYDKLNKERITEYRKRYNKENKEKMNEYNRNYRNSDKYKESKRINKEKRKEYRKKYGEEHRDELNEKGRLYYEKIRKNKPYIIAWRQILKSFLRRKKIKKDDDTINLLGYNSDDLKQHLESLFSEGMTWYNWGEWHVDHKIPLSFFSEDTPIDVVNSLENLQPLWSDDNLAKGNRMLEEYKTMDIYIKYCI